MTDEEVVSALKRVYVDGVRDWDDNYDAFIADVQRRIGCFSVELARRSKVSVGTRAPVGDVMYYSLEVPIEAPADRFMLTAEDVTAQGGEAYYLVAYCSTILPVAEIRWHAVTLGTDGTRVRASHDLFDPDWLASHRGQESFALDVVAAAEHCGWQIIGPTLTEREAPKSWPWPFPTYDYQDGEYLIRDYLIKGMREY